MCTALCCVRLSDSIKVYSKYWTFQNWSGHNIHTENPANFTEEILVFYWVWFFDFKANKRDEDEIDSGYLNFAFWSWIGLLWNVLFTLLYKIDVKQTRIKVYCCGGWLVEKQSLSQNFTETLKHGLGKLQDKVPGCLICCTFRKESALTCVVIFKKNY